MFLPLDFSCYCRWLVSGENVKYKSPSEANHSVWQNHFGPGTCQSPPWWWEGTFCPCIMEYNCRNVSEDLCLMLMDLHFKSSAWPLTATIHWLLSTFLLFPRRTLTTCPMSPVQMNQWEDSFFFRFSCSLVHSSVHLWYIYSHVSFQLMGHMMIVATKVAKDKGVDGQYRVGEINWILVMLAMCCSAAV